MNSFRPTGWDVLLAMGLIGMVSLALPSPAQPVTGGEATNEIRILTLQGRAEVSTDGGANWVSTQTNQVLKSLWHLRTGANSRLTLRWSDQSVVPFGPLTEIEILPPHQAGAQSGLRLFKGILSFFHRDKPGRIRLVTRGAVAGVEGTEFVLAVDAVDENRTTISLIDGSVRFSNEHGELTLTNGQQAIGEAGRAPVLTAGFIVNNVLQWCFYYPALLDLRDLPLTVEEQRILSDSLAAYRTGDLLAALALYPAERQPGSDAERIYYAALLLSVGQVEKTEAALGDLRVADPSERLQRLATALRQLIAAVKRQPNPSTLNPQLSTELLAASYYEQSLAVRETSLRNALRLATQAVTHSPAFGFAWARLAELEFSFGHIGRAREALNKSLMLSPRNAQALALKGFLLAAQNKTREAIESFDTAIAVDSALANAWLGRGLCKIRLTPSFFSLPVDRVEAREISLQSALDDLLVAAALEPQRSLLRSYLGKAYGSFGDTRRALHELELAKRLDPNDPTPWLYSALERRLENEINPAIQELERSVEHNENRRVYRSQLLLDQDRAVRSSSLARIYQDADMPEVALREATRAVNYDYANYSAHLFLSDSFNALRDPTRFNLRHETVWFNELLLANLLSPVGGTPLSPNISQQEYTRFFERNRVGMISSTEYRSDGQVRELASQFGTIGNTGWSLDLDYQHNEGVRPNNELDRLEWYTTIKQQLTPQDSLLLLIKYQEYHSGDNFQYCDPTALTTNLAFYGLPLTPVIRTNFTFDEYQQPIAVAGYHHEWSPGIHTLLLGGRLENDQRFSDRNALQSIVTTSNEHRIVLANTLPFDVTLRNQFEIFTGELNQIFQGEQQHLVLGGRIQTGEFETTDRLTLSPLVIPVLPYLTNYFDDPPAATQTRESFSRLSGYAYYTVELLDNFLLTSGLSYDQITFPANYRKPPISSGTEEREQLSPKAAAVWSPLPQITLRGAFCHALGGVSFDESFRLEPTQLAGFNQAFRSIISESIVGGVSAPTYEIAGLGLDVKLKTRTYLGIQTEWLNSHVHQDVGVFKYETGDVPPPPPVRPASTPQTLDYEEQSFTITLNQLTSEHWSLGAQYRFTQSELRSIFHNILPSVSPDANSTQEAKLHQAVIFSQFDHPSGFFARAEGRWYQQDSSLCPSSDLYQANAFIGYRFPRQRGEVSVGVLNINDADYRLDPLTPYPELPRERVFVARLTIRL